MREIKFRAWIEYSNGGSEMLPNIQNHIGASWGFGHFVANTVKDSNAIVMQFTGLKDKNGIEIYEGDIVKVDGLIIDVIYNKRFACFELRSTGNSVGFYKQIEVIGNIYENPELLKNY